MMRGQLGGNNCRKIGGKNEKRVQGKWLWLNESERGEMHQGVPLLSARRDV